MATRQMKRSAAHLPIPTLHISILHISTAAFGFGLFAGETHFLIVLGSTSGGNEHSVLFVFFANWRFKLGLVCFSAGIAPTSVSRELKSL